MNEFLLLDQTLGPWSDSLNPLGPSWLPYTALSFCLPYYLLQMRDLPTITCPSHCLPCWLTLSQLLYLAIYAFLIFSSTMGHNEQRNFLLMTNVNFNSAGHKTGCLLCCCYTVFVTESELKYIVCNSQVQVSWTAINILSYIYRL